MEWKMTSDPINNRGVLTLETTITITDEATFPPIPAPPVTVTIEEWDVPEDHKHFRYTVNWKVAPPQLLIWTAKQKIDNGHSSTKHAYETGKMPPPTFTVPDPFPTEHSHQQRFDWVKNFLRRTASIPKDM